jgi:hypothetical protein
MNAFVSPDLAHPPANAGLPSVKALFERMHQLFRQRVILLRETVTCVRTLQETCEEQFAAEESTALVREICTQAPWLERSFKDLSSQHGALRQRLSSLVRNLECNEPRPRCWEEFAEELSFFEQQLCGHEQAAVDFWQEACNLDVGTKD